MMPITQAATLNRLSLSESDTNPVISGQLQKILQVTFGYLQTVPAISVLFKGGNSNAQNLNYETFVGTSKSNLHQSPEFNGDCYSAKYSAQQTPLKNGNSPSLPVRRNLLIKLNCAETGQLANSLILSRNAQSVCREIKHEKYSGSVKPENYSGSAVIQNGCNYENQQVKSKEKGGTENTALCDDGFFHHEINQHLAAWHVRTCETFVGHRVTVSKPVQPSGTSLGFLRWRRLISPCMAVTINCPVVSPSSFTNSIASTTSCGARACTFCDLLLIWSLCTTGLHFCLWNPVYIKKEIKKELKWNPVDVYTGIHLIVLFAIKLAKPRSATNTIWASNHNVIGANTMALQHSTQTRPKFQYLFLAVCRSDLNATPHRESVTAHSEQDARRTLAGQFVLSFAGRIPAQGVCNA